MKRLFLPCLLAAAALVAAVPAFTATDPALVGQWSSIIPWPAVAIHAHLLNTGKLLTWQDGATATVWDPASGTFTAVPNSFTNLLCVGHNFLPDGRFITIGGAGLGPGVKDVDIFDPQSLSWSQASPMSSARWYPGLIVRPNGQPMAISGSQDIATNLVPTPESYDPATNAWTVMTEATNLVPYYPFTFILPDGRLFASGASEQAYASQVYDSNTHIWTAVDPTTYDGASAVMYEPGKILKAGSASDGGFPADPSSAAAYVIDMNQPSPLWRQVAFMAFPRAFLNLTSLPDGSVLATGGGTTKDGQNLANAVLPAELWSPATETWTTVASMATPRLYHSQALLLPDGRVFVGGSGGDSGVADQKSAEIYSPPYLFKGARPVISSAPSVVNYGGTFSVTTPDASSIASVRLISLGSVTHGFNMNQHALSLDFVQAPGSVAVTAPANANLATPGYYMLFLVNSNGVPSVSTFVSLPVQAAPPPPPGPTALAASVTSSDVTLMWIAPASGTVSTYNVYRSTTSGFVPNAGTLIGQSSTTTYTDPALTNGTYFYRVIASVGGTPTAGSNEASATVTLASSALAVDKAVSVDGSGARTTPVFSTAGPGELLVAFVASDGPSPGPQTMTVSGAGLTWSLVRRVNAQAGTSEIWKASAASALTNVSVTSTPASGSYYQSLTVVMFSGAAGVGSSAGANAVTGSPAVVLTTTQRGSLIYGVGNDWDRAIARTPGAGQVLFHQYLPPAGDTFWFQNLTSASAGPGLQAQLNDTAPTTDRWNLAAVEILPAVTQTSWSVTGTLSPSSGGAGATLTLSGTAAATTTADSAGNYIFSSLANGSYTVTPAKSGYAFAPANQSVTVSGANVTGINFAAQPVVVSGNVSGATGVTIMLTGGATTTTDALGNYTFSPVASGTYTVTPAKSGYTFTPASQSVIVSGASVTGVNFPAQAVPTYSISGTIGTLATGPGTTVVLGGAASATATADSSGNYTFSNLVNGSYTVTPAKSGYAFTPGTQAVTIIGANVTGVNFTAQAGPTVDKVIVADGRGSRTTPAFSTAAPGELLLAFVASDGPSSVTQSMTVSGAGLVWRLVKRANGQRGTAEIWQATASSQLSNVTVASTPKSSGYDQSLTVIAFGNSGGVGAFAALGATTGAPSLSLTTTKAGSLVYGVGNDWDQAIARTPGPNQVLVHQWVDTISGDTLWMQAVSGAIPAAGTVTTVNDSAPTADRWNLAAVEILVK